MPYTMNKKPFKLPSHPYQKHFFIVVIKYCIFPYFFYIFHFAFHNTQPIAELAKNLGSYSVERLSMVF